jgi:hypothetical protein
MLSRIKRIQAHNRIEWNSTTLEVKKGILISKISDVLTEGPVVEILIHMEARGLNLLVSFKVSRRRRRRAALHAFQAEGRILEVVYRP